MGIAVHVAGAEDLISEDLALERARKAEHEVRINMESKLMKTSRS